MNSEFKKTASWKLFMHDVLYHQGTGKVITGRVDNLAGFMGEYFHTVDDAAEKISIEINKSVYDCPKPSTAKAYRYLGGTNKTYLEFGNQCAPYHVWAVIRREQPMQAKQPKRPHRQTPHLTLVGKTSC
ncbi:MAG: hypothetical protein JKY52_19905 [Flavobacteriales bacterium]|nr:hypothetical protein [Flavobacteriales bacterium]